MQISVRRFVVCGTVVAACEVLCVCVKMLRVTGKAPEDIRPRVPNMSGLVSRSKLPCAHRHGNAHSLSLSSCLSAPQLQGFTQQPRRPTTIMKRSPML